VKWRSKLTGVDSLVKINEALLGSLQASLDDGLFSLDLSLGKPLGKLFSCSSESDSGVS
jgi:hypothetical protein